MLKHIFTVSEVTNGNNEPFMGVDLKCILIARGLIASHNRLKPIQHANSAITDHVIDPVVSASNAGYAVSKSLLSRLFSRENTGD